MTTHVGLGLVGLGLAKSDHVLRARLFLAEPLRDLSLLRLYSVLLSLEQSSISAVVLSSFAVAANEDAGAEVDEVVSTVDGGATPISYGSTKLGCPCMTVPQLGIPHIVSSSSSVSSSPK